MGDWAGADSGSWSGGFAPTSGWVHTDIVAVRGQPEASHIQSWDRIQNAASIPSQRHRRCPRNPPNARPIPRMAGYYVRLTLQRSSLCGSTTIPETWLRWKSKQTICKGQTNLSKQDGYDWNPQRYNIPQIPLLFKTAVVLWHKLHSMRGGSSLELTSLTPKRDRLTIEQIIQANFHFLAQFLVE